MQILTPNRRSWSNQGAHTQRGGTQAALHKCMLNAIASCSEGHSWAGIFLTRIFSLIFFATSTIILVCKFCLKILLDPPLGKSAPLEICSQAMLHIEPNSNKRRSSVMVSLWRPRGKGRGWVVFSGQRVTRNILKRREDLFFSLHCPNTWGVHHRFAFDLFQSRFCFQNEITWLASLRETWTLLAAGFNRW